MKTTTPHHALRIAIAFLVLCLLSVPVLAAAAVQAVPDVQRVAPVASPTVTLQKIHPDLTLNPVPVTIVTKPPASGEQWISGTMSSGTLTCTHPGDQIVYQGSGGNLTDGTPITFTIFNVPPGTAQDLPAAGVQIGTATVDSNHWKFTWNGGVPGYSLTPGKEYLVKASISDTISLKFGLLYQCGAGDPWIAGGAPPSSNITCGPTTAIATTFMGSSGNISAGTPITFVIYDYPEAAPTCLPATGVVLGTALVENDGTFHFPWNGTVPGYPLTYNQPYLIREKLSETQYLKVGILYLCKKANVATAAAPSPAGLVTAAPDTVAGGSVSPGDSNLASRALNPQPEPPAVSGDGASLASGVPSSALNPQPEPPSPFKPIFDFFNGLFGSKKTP
ncbi:MAG: hypothetical protein GYA23_10870 [Methanomicrobiales archaeon]|nr:hypothetical protein [Methanomicrobiales archaeon]